MKSQLPRCSSSRTRRSSPPTTTKIFARRASPARSDSHSSFSSIAFTMAERSQRSCAAASWGVTRSSIGVTAPVLRSSRAQVETPCSLPPKPRQSACPSPAPSGRTPPWGTQPRVNASAHASLVRRTDDIVPIFAGVSHYIHGTDPEEQRRLSNLNETLNARSLAELRPRAGERLLDVGSGLGQLTRAIARATGTRAVGVERSVQQLAQAQRLAAEAGEDGLVEWRSGEA